MPLDKVKITERFNETGFPFQYWCLETIRNIDKDFSGAWKSLAVSEYPFTFPKSEGPLLGIHGTIDIVAVRGIRGIQDALLFLIIECKRADSKIKNWIFIQDRQVKKPTFASSKIENEALKESLLVDHEMRFQELGYINSEQFDYCIQVVEINDKLTTINKNQEEKVYKALKQVNHGVYALAMENPKKIEGFEEALRFKRWQNFVYLPVLITTANLYIANLNYKDIKAGDILSSAVEYKEKKWLTYEFPLPDFISYKAEDGLRIKKLTTFIVNHESFAEFVQKVGAINVF